MIKSINSNKNKKTMKQQFKSIAINQPSMKNIRKAVRLIKKAIVNNEPHELINKK